MALLSQSVQVPAQLGKFFESLREGQAPDSFTRSFLKDLGFKSSNHFAFIPLLKGLGFLDSNGTPTARYKEFLDETKWRQVLAEAVREAYGDIFVIKSQPGKSDRKAISGKYKSTYNLSDTVADRSAATFLALLELADPETLHQKGNDQEESVINGGKLNGHLDPVPKPIQIDRTATARDVGLHYNIQIHLPATKDLEVYNAIFRSLKEHLVD